MSKQEYLLLAGMNYPQPNGKEGEEVRREAGDVVDDLPARSVKDLIEMGAVVRVGKRIEALIKEHKKDPDALIAAVRQEKGIEADEVEVVVNDAPTVFQPDPEPEPAKAEVVEDGAGKGGDE
jgi:hypothetical protein